MILKRKRENRDNYIYRIEKSAIATLLKVQKGEYTNKYGNIYCSEHYQTHPIVSYICIFTVYCMYNIVCFNYHHVQRDSRCQPNDQSPRRAAAETILYRQTTLSFDLNDFVFLVFVDTVSMCELFYFVCLILKLFNCLCWHLRDHNQRSPALHQSCGCRLVCWFGPAPCHTSMFCV